MSNKQEKVLELLQRFAPTEFGIRHGLYRFENGKMDVVFFVSKKSAQSAISYLNALSALIEKEVKGIEIESSVYIYDQKRDFEKTLRDEQLEELDLMSLDTAGARV
jgi:hypothetical protein